MQETCAENLKNSIKVHLRENMNKWREETIFMGEMT